MQHRLHLHSKSHNLPERSLSGAHRPAAPGSLRQCLEAQPITLRALLATGYPQDDLSRPLAGSQGETIALGEMDEHCLLATQDSAWSEQGRSGWPGVLGVEVCWCGLPLGWLRITAHCEFQSSWHFLIPAAPGGDVSH